MTLQSDGPLRCAEHPNVETYLRCGRCETPICPRCMEYTPVGTRCRSCANVRTIPTYDVKPAFLARAIVAGVLAAIAMALAWIVIRFLPGASFFLLWASVFLGYGIGEAISLATNRKRGSALVAVAVVSSLITYLIAKVGPFAGFVLVGAPLPLTRLLSASEFGLLYPLSLVYLIIITAVAVSRVR